VESEVGIGISTPIFILVRTLLLAPLPYDNPERRVHIISRSTNSSEPFDGTAPLRDILDWHLIGLEKLLAGTLASLPLSYELITSARLPFRRW